MKTKIFNNLLLKILSVVAAVLLWLMVVNIDDAIDSKPFRNVKVNMINTDILMTQGQMCRIEEGTDTVDLTVYARRSVLKDLKASDFIVTADMQKDLRYGSMVKIEVEYTGNATIDRIEQNRENVLVSIEQSVTKQFKVAVETKGECGNGLVVGSTIPAQTLVEITGPISTVERIKRVKAEVNITGITGTVVRLSTLQLLDGDGNPVDGTYLNYIGKDSEFEVTVTTLNTKQVGISFDISQVAPEGYGLSAISYTPETVEIAGLKSQIGPIYNLDIPPEALNPDRESGKVVQTVDISQYLSSGLLIPNESDREIVVTMEIVPYQSVSYVLTGGQIQYQNVPEGYTLDLSETPPLEIVVSGMVEALAGVSLENISASVDLSACQRAGTYHLPVTVTVPEGCVGPEGLETSVRLLRVEDEE